MRVWLRAHAPVAGRRTHLLLAAAMWSIVGVLLLFFGARWAWPSRYRFLLLPSAVLIGAIKAHLVLGRAARRIIARIEARGDGRCIGGFLSPKTWLLVAAMAGTGRLLRSGPVPRVAVGFIYTAVGAALLPASLHLWRAWQGARPRF